MAVDVTGGLENEPSRRPKALIIDGDELSLALVENLEECGVSAQRAYNQSQARALLRSLRFDVVVSETALADGDGETIFLEALPFLKSTRFIFTGRDPQIDQVVRLIRAGALDYIEKPYDPPSLAQKIRGIIDARRTTSGNAPTAEPRMRSAAMALIGEQLKKLAGNNVGVLLVGEVGSGKKAIARRLHQISSRSAEPLVEIRCGSLSGEDSERIFFGAALTNHANGSLGYSPGVIEQTGEGTLFLDRIEEMPATIQMKLIQAISDKRFHRIGDVSTYVPFRPRLISSSEYTVSDLRQRINQDLLYRLAIVELKVPPLRSRQDDIEDLMSDLMEECAVEIGCEPLPIEPEAVSAARLYEWPGNVRELRTRLLRALSLGTGKKIGAADLFPEAGPGTTARLATRHLDEARAAAEREQIVQALATTDGRIGDAAKELGISRVTLWMKMKRLGLQQGADRPSDADA